MHRLGQMRRLRMLEEQKAWKREVDFDYITAATGMDSQRSRINLASEPFFYSKMFNSRWPHTHDEFALEMRVDVEGIRMEIFLSEPEPPPQCDQSTRRLPEVDAGSEEPGTPRRSPVIGTESDEPGVSRTESTERKYIFPLQTSVDVFSRFNCTSSEQECILFQPDVGVDDEKDQPTTSQQAAAREEFARPTKKRQQQRMTAWTTKQNKQFDPGGQD